MSQGLGFLPIVTALVGAGTSIVTPLLEEEGAKVRAADERKLRVSLASQELAAERVRAEWVVWGAGIAGAVLVVGFGLWIWTRS